MLVQRRICFHLGSQHQPGRYPSLYCRHSSEKGSGNCAARYILRSQPVFCVSALVSGKTTHIVSAHASLVLPDKLQQPAELPLWREMLPSKCISLQGFPLQKN